MKKSLLALFAAVLVVTPSVATAQRGNNNNGGGNTPVLSALSCQNYLGVIFRDFAATKCSGWWEGNENKGAVPAQPVFDALEALGLNDPEYLEKLEFGSRDDDDLTKQLSINFATPLYGTTVIGIHWGGGVFKSINGAPQKLGTAFFWFNAGTTGLDEIFMSQTWSQSVSNAALYDTGKPCTVNCGGGGNEVPEPTSFALMGAGLLGLGVVSRRRKRAS